MNDEVAALRSRLRLGDDAEWWLEELAELGPPTEPLVLPEPQRAAAQLARIAVPERDIAEIVAALPDPARDPDLWWLLEREHDRVVRDMGSYAPTRGGPTLPYVLGATARYFYVYLFLVSIPAALRFQSARGIPDEISWDTFTDLGEKVAIHRRKYGTGGMNTQFWFLLHLRGTIYRLGRLQFNLQRLDRDRGDPRAGQPVLGTHIPAVGGPMTPQACDASFARARPFFDGHFPEHGARVARCSSWLLDPQLAEYLPESSNIVGFLRRWILLDEEPEPDSTPPHPESQPGDRSVLEFVFRRTDQPLTELPQRTTLERAAVAHLRAGRHWHVRTGWLTLP